MKLIFVDTNAQLCETVKQVFQNADVRNCPLDQVPQEDYDILLTPGNSYGFMDGGFDLAVRNLLPFVEQNVQQGIKNVHHGVLPIGSATSFSLDMYGSRHLVYAPTMRVPSSIQGTDNVYWAFRAALLEARRLESSLALRTAREANVLTCPFGTASGCMSYVGAAHQMRMALQHVMRSTEEIQFFQPYQAWNDHNELQMYKF